MECVVMTICLHSSFILYKHFLYGLEVLHYLKSRAEQTYVNAIALIEIAAC